MKLGLREIGTVAALAAAGCTSATPEDAKNEAHPVCAVPDVRSEVITERMVAGIRARCSQEANAVVGRLSSEWMGFGSMTNRTTAEIEEECLALHGLTLEGDITDTMPTDQPFESDIKADRRRCGGSIFKIDGAEFGGGGGGLISEI